ncbi:MAG: calcium-binding protein, partial [Pseudomonadota bacterium]
MAGIDDLNILTNGDFSNGLTGWTVDNPTGGPPPGVVGGTVAFNRGGETLFGDSIDQDIVTTVGNTYAVTLDLIENNGGNSSHTFEIDILDGTGTVIETVTETVENNSTNQVGFTFTATTTAPNIRITNISATNSSSSDGKVDNVRVIDVTGDDDIEGTGGDDLILGGAGNDTIDGGAGNDLVYGGDGADTINGGGGDDILYGGGDIDVYSQLDDGGNTQIFDLGGNATLDVSGFTSGVTVDTGTNVGGTGLLVSGNSTTITVNNSTSGIDVLIGTEFDDDVQEFFIDVIDLAGGNDILRTFQNNAIGERFDGGAGIDTLDFSDADAGTTFNMETGEFIGTQGAFNFENAVGSAFGDTITGSAAGNSIDGGAGNDDIFAGQGDDTVFGGAGRDFIEDGAGNDTVFGGDGGDQLDSGDGDDILYGGEGDDEINDFGTGNDTLFGGDGGDALYSGDGDDTVFGGDGDDIMGGEDGDDILYGGAGNDDLESGFGEDVLYGGDGDDEFAYFEDVTQHAFGGDGADTLDISGSRTHDLTDDTIDSIEHLEVFDVATSVEVALNADQLEGFETIEARLFEVGDRLDFDVELNGDTTADLSGIAIDEGAATLTISITGNQVADTITGSQVTDVIYGLGGGDTLAGGSGQDTLFGGNGNDTFIQGNGETVDDIFGGDGIDTVDLSAELTNGVDANLDSAGETLTGLGGTVDLVDIERFIGTQASDTIEAGFTSTIDGQGGDDIILGDFGTQSLIGGSGNDTFINGDGEFIDDIDGGTGNDTVDMSA